MSSEVGTDRNRGGSGGAALDFRPAMTRPARTVLVVDDDTEFREVVSEQLKAHNFEVLEAANGLEALLQIKRNRPGVVLLDLAMPRLGGLETLTWIRSFDPGITVIVVTGLSDPESTALARERGAAAVLEKPVDVGALLEQLSSLPVRSPLQASVLVVDDDREMCALLRDFLRGHGHDVREAGDGGAALREVARQAPDIVLLDIAMPGLSGVDALSAIRALAPATKVIMISGIANLEVAKLALARGAFDYITKPFDFGYLAQAVETAVIMKRMEL
ncbi:MAG: response regulator [Candidatus Rokubacteria bacterium]|nr:response regulator [Candidatus Rokubacteria bacterium]